MKSDEPAEDRSRLEWLVVGLMTLIGAVLRFWPFGRLGLTHFDEGIYGLASSGEMAYYELIPYAPPGFPILGKLAFQLLGRSDSALILVSQIAGTLTIPVVAWMGRRSFGAGGGFASSVFCALSGPAIAYSRMALTDASFLLAWLIALSAGMRFLDRPGFVRALLMGLAVGVAQEFKYNGWLSGGIVIGTALVGIVVRPEERNLGSIAKIFGWGGFAAVVAWLVVWPWYAFVDAHGGYSALLRHQRGYLGGFGDWWPNLCTQADQAVALSGGPWLILPTLTLVGLTPWIGGSSLWREVGQSFPKSRRFIVAAFGVVFFVSWHYVDAPYLTGFLAIPWLFRKPGGRLIVIWWSVLLISSPFYRPYSRLWLPLEASHWLLMAWVFARAIPELRLFRSRQDPLPIRRIDRLIALASLTLWVGFGMFVNTGSKITRHASPQVDLLAPSDSLRQATYHVSLLLPDEVKGLLLLVRPPVVYYLAGRMTLLPMAGSDSLTLPGRSDIWVLLDSAILRSEKGLKEEESVRNYLERFSKHWEVVQAFPTSLSLPTLLDLDPGAARSESADRNCSLWLLRPRRPGANQ